jgi:hypothetical protein
MNHSDVPVQPVVEPDAEGSALGEMAQLRAAAHGPWQAMIANL